MGFRPAERGQPQPQALPPVRIVVLGATGSGKTSLVKALTKGMEAESTFPLTVGNTVESETTATNVVTAGTFLIVDPPGIGDTHGNDDTNMVDLAKTVRGLEEVHLVVLVFNGQQVRLDTPIVHMLRLFENVFGPAFWANAAVVFTRWFPDEIGELPGDEVGKKREWNDKLKAEFPFLSENRKAAPIPCFFVNSVVVHDDRYRASQKMKEAVALNEATMKDVRLLAQALQPLRTSSVTVSHSQPAAAHDVEQFLHGLGLARHIPRVLEQRIYSRDVLGELSGPELASLGFSQEAMSKVLRGVGSCPVPDVVVEGERPETPEQLAIELGSFGVPTEPFATYTVHAALSLSEDLVVQSLPLLGDRKAFQRWKRQRVAGQKVSDECLWLGAFVERGLDWEYDADSDEDAVPQDGEPGGHGVVVGWHPRAGDRVGGDVPTSPGWVRVRWLSTGFSHNYRAGADSKYDLRFASGTPPGESLDGVDKLEIKHLRCTFGYATSLRYPHFSMFDVRPEVCRMAGGFEHGDVVMEDHGVRAVCIGVKPEDPKRIRLWFHPKDRHADGVGIFGDLDSGKYRKVGHERVQPAKREDFPCGSDVEIENDDRDYVLKNLQPTFGYNNRLGFKRFDIRDEITARFTLGVRHGDVLLDSVDRKEMRCIGVALLGNGSPFPRMWFHEEGDLGAAVLPNMHKQLNRFNVLRNEAIPEAAEEEQPRGLSEQELQAIAAELQPTFAFPQGLTGKPPLCRFDIRPSIVSRITGGLLPGQVFHFQGNKLVVVGAAPHPLTNQPTVWFHREGDPGAGQLDLDPRLLRRCLRDAVETMDLSELKNRLAASTMPVSSDVSSESEEVVEDVREQLRRLFLAMQAHHGGRL